MIRSEFSYDRNIVRDISRALADMRHYVPAGHLPTLDQINVAVSDAIFVNDFSGSLDFLAECHAYRDLPHSVAETQTSTSTNKENNCVREQLHPDRNLTREPELRFTAGGKGVCNFGLAVNRRYQVNGEWQEKVSFFNVTVWDTQGENIAACLTKGARVIVNGRLEQRDYETTDGDKRSVVEVIADEVGPSLRWATAEVTKVQSNREGASQARETAPAGRPADPRGDEEPF